MFAAAAMLEGVYEHARFGNARVHSPDELDPFAFFEVEGTAVDVTS